MIIKHLLSAGLTSIMLTGLIYCPYAGMHTAQAIQININRQSTDENTNAASNSDNASTETNANNNEAFSLMERISLMSKSGALVS